SDGSPASAPAGDYVAVTSSRLPLTGRTAPGPPAALSHEAGPGRLHALPRPTGAPRGVFTSPTPSRLGTTPSNARPPEAAAAAAAHAALVGLFPAQAALLDAQLAAALRALPGGPARRRGVALGEAVANQVLALRSHDGSDLEVAYDPAPGPGVWVPTPPAYAPPVDPKWGRVIPFSLSGGDQFRPPPPPPITSAQYAAEYNQVEALGGVDSTARTPDQTALAHFWSDLAGTFDPPGHWNQIAEIAAVAHRTDLADSARLF